MFNIKSLVFTLLTVTLINVNAESTSQQKKDDADSKRRAYENNKKKSKKQYPDTFDANDAGNQNDKDYILTDQTPPHDWSKPAPPWRDVKCDKCNGTGIIKEVVGNKDPQLKIKICKTCSGKGTLGKTKN
jgi:DnaJ-class molecular chaperone